MSQNEGPVTGLPERYEDVLNQRLAEMRSVEARTSPAAAAAAAGPRQWMMRGALAICGAAALFMVMGAGRSSARTENSSPITRDNLVSARSVGVSNDVESLLPPSPAPLTSAPAEGAPGEAEQAQETADMLTEAIQPDDHTPPSAGAPRSSVSSRPAKKECTDCEKREARASTRREEPEEMVLAFDEEEEPGLVVAAASEDPVVLNVGSQFAATLTRSVRTSASPVPVSARVTKDVWAGEQLAIAAGATLVGRAVAIHENDRIQVVFTALVQDGATAPLQALAMGTDGDLGIQGKLIRKASGKKKWAGRAVRAVGSALTLGLLTSGGGGVVDTATGDLLSQGTSDLSGLEQRWTLQRSDKVVEAPAGTSVMLYLESDLAVR